MVATGLAVKNKLDRTKIENSILNKNFGNDEKTEEKPEENVEDKIKEEEKKIKNTINELEEFYENKNYYRNENDIMEKVRFLKKQNIADDEIKRKSNDATLYVVDDFITLHFTIENLDEIKLKINKKNVENLKEISYSPEIQGKYLDDIIKAIDNNEKIIIPDPDIINTFWKNNN